MEHPLGNWAHRKTHLGYNKEIYDAELYAIGTALKVAVTHSSQWKARGIAKYCSSQTLRQPLLGCNTTGSGPGKQW